MLDPRDKWQWEAEDAWNTAGGFGTIQAGTGTGKTVLAIKIAKKYVNFCPKAVIHVVVPTTYLKDQWKKDILKFAGEYMLNHIYIFVINTYAKVPRNCNLLIIDEFHRAGGPSFKKIIRYQFDHILAMTATLYRKDLVHLELQRVSPVIYKLLIKDARKLGFVSDYQIYNLGVDFDDMSRAVYKDIQARFLHQFAAFDNNFQTAMGCVKGEQWALDEMSNYMGLPEDVVRGKAFGWNTNMRKRKEMLYKAPAKLPVIKDLINGLGGKTLVFSKTVDFCDQIAEIIPKCAAYHSEIKTQVIDGKKIGPKKYKENIINNFEGTGLDTIASAKSLEEGFSVNEVTTVINASYDSDIRGFVQKLGRAVRFVEGKKAIMVNLYMKDFIFADKKVSSKELGWLKESQKGNTSSVKWVDSISDIIQPTEISF